MLLLQVAVSIMCVAVVRTEKRCDCGESLLSCNSLWFEHKMYLTLDEEQPNGNLLFSPLSVYRSLMILGEGAKGPTKETIEKYLFVALWYFKINCDPLGKMRADYNKFDGIIKKDKVLKVVSQLLYNRAIQSQSNDFGKKMNFYSDFKVEKTFNFANKSTHSNINNLVKNETDGLISNIFNDGDFTPQTPMLVTNQILFSDIWDHPFIAVTRQRSRKNKSFYMMDRRGHFYYDFDETSKTEYIIVNFKTPGYRIAFVRDTKLKYTGPPTPQWSKLQTNKKASDATLLRIPKFRIETEYELESVLDKMGLGIVFDKKRGDFSGTGPEHPQCMSRIVIKAYIDVNEDGVEAAAATMALQESPKRPQPLVSADYHGPFNVYLIAHGYVVFHARVEDPTF